MRLARIHNKLNHLNLTRTLAHHNDDLVRPLSPPLLRADRVGVTAPPPPPRDAASWTDDPWAPVSSLDVRRRVFCNRSLNFNTLTAVGFDLDYTLAQYKSEEFESLAHRFTTEKLVTVFGYPEVVREFVFDWRYMMRGLIIDKKRGNTIKVRMKRNPHSLRRDLHGS